MVKNINIARDLGYLQDPRRAARRARTTSSCCRPTGWPSCARAARASRSRRWRASPTATTARGDQKGDTVVISARAVPGNEKSVYRTIDRLFAAGARVIYESSAGVHVSGHAAAEELKLMLNLVQPKYFMPIHGEHRHLHFHSELAKATGVPADNIFLLENGDVSNSTRTARASPARCRPA